MSKMQSVNPATLKVSREIDTTDPSEIPGIIEGCRKAQGEWIDMPKRMRLACLDRLLDIIVDRADEIAATIHADTGKPRSECHSTEILTAIGMTKYARSLLKDFKFKERIKQGPMSMMCTFMGRRWTV